jgi:hypothetical protein
VSLLIIEGETEQIFYRIIQDNYLQGIRYRTFNIKGQGSINRQVVGRIQRFVRDNPDDMVRAYCCLDAVQETRTATPLDMEIVREQIRARKLKTVLSVDAILADPEIESWFFYDIEGIYKFLRAKRSERNVRKYRNPGSLGKADLQRLFRRFDQEYSSGKRAEHFIRSLDMEKIISSCTGLKAGVDLIKSQARDRSNHILVEYDRKPR